MKYAVVNSSASGDNTVIAAVDNKRIRVIHYTLGCDQNADIYFKSDGTTNLTGKIYFSASSSFSAGYGAITPIGMVGMFETNIGEALVININGAKTVSGHITYLVVD